MRHRIGSAAALAVFLLAPGPFAAAQPPPAPTAPASSLVAETPASELGRRLLAAAKAGDDAFLAFSHEVDPNTRRPDDVTRTMGQQLAAIQLHALVAATPTHAEFQGYDPNIESWVLLTLDVPADAPHTITGLRLRASRRPADVAAPPRLQPAALVAAARQRLEAAAAADRFSGAVLIEEAGKPVLSAAYGLADREAKTPAATDTQFRFGSMGKMFTAVSIMQLIQAGKIDPTAPIGRYLPGYPNRDIADHVTVNNLLTHTGGTGDIFGPEFEAHRLALKEPADYVALYGGRPPLFAPGARDQYSNYGFMLLGRIVETVSGQSYDDYISAHIFKPAGMTATGNQPESVHLPKRVVGYMSRGGQLVSTADTLPWRGTPAGGGYSTTGDLGRFANALMANRLLDAAHTKMLTDGGFTGADGKFWRYDFGAPAGDGRRYYGHNGGAPGMNGELRIFPAEAPKDGKPSHPAYTVAVLANRDPPAATGVANFITDRLP
ncbi:MAG TPA: serine hydrolase domain-containing protein [Phenylobacterium sp.]|jgi:D-alanyl-D-alanine carboxypeptidase|uniref:serine hydrolase domain-containing protein n=1 Tax=Phenylobacterium sp. TaxID=1871053 RepID=UPI002D075EC1|nr:serine hydrolase domain-containing protein [Phenylobacterium sp.]HXA40208.1 serine hydrolase domain-containing protein [Phenylobacterium sp.]